MHHATHNHTTDTDPRVEATVVELYPDVFDTAKESAQVIVRTMKGNERSLDTESRVNGTGAEVIISVHPSTGAVRTTVRGDGSVMRGIPSERVVVSRFQLDTSRDQPLIRGLTCVALDDDGLYWPS